MERLKKIISYSGLSKKEFARRIGLTASPITELLQGRSKNLSATSLIAIATEFNVNPVWLVTGKGDMFLTGSGSFYDELSDIERKVIASYREKKELQQAVKILLGVDDETVINDEPVLVEAESYEPVEVEEYPANVESITTVKERLSLYKAPKPPLPNEAEIPIIGKIAAGVPFFAEENVEGVIRVPTDRLFGKSPKNLFGLKVVGMSMEEENIGDGDTVILEKVVSVKDQVKDGDVVAALIDGEATLKYIHFGDGKVELRPGNPEFKSRFLTEKDFVVIQGKCFFTLWGGYTRTKVE